METKQCSLCRKHLPLNKFDIARGYKNGVRSRCKVCEYNRKKQWRENNRQLDRATKLTYYRNNKDKHRATYLKSKYGLTLEQYEQMLSDQKGLCAICQKSPPPNKCLHVDHDHRTGRNRALLCGSCNRAIGLLQDNPEIALALASYLQRFQF